MPTSTCHHHPSSLPPAPLPGCPQAPRPGSDQVHGSWHLAGVDVLNRVTGFKSSFNHNGWLSRDGWYTELKESAYVQVGRGVLRTGRGAVVGGWGPMPALWGEGGQGVSRCVGECWRAGGSVGGCLG